MEAHPGQRWLFETEEFRCWNRERFHEPGIQSALSQCRSCGGELDEIGLRQDAICGYCLAYEYGAHCEARRFARALSGLIQTALYDEEAFHRLSTQLLEDSASALFHEGYLSITHH